MTEIASSRARMVERQLAARGIGDGRVLEAMGAVPRELFVPEELRANAYDDGPLPIGQGQTISQPYIVAVMIAAARIGASDRVLEIGAGSGYAAAVMARLAGEVIAIERHAALADAAAERLRRLGIDNARVVAGDGSIGWPEAAPFNAILAAASGPEVPNLLKDQLAPGGRLVMPLGPPGEVQKLVRVTQRDGGFDEDDLGPVRFVPLIGRRGFPEG